VGDLDMPFEPGDRFELDLEHAFVAGGVVVMAAAIPTPDGDQIPALVFRFANVDGTGFDRPTVLALHDPSMARALPKLITNAIRAAKAASS
jgi:hypothetical protein